MRLGSILIWLNLLSACTTIQFKKNQCDKLANIAVMIDSGAGQTTSADAAEKQEKVAAMMAEMIERDCHIKVARKADSDSNGEKQSLNVSINNYTFVPLVGFSLKLTYNLHEGSKIIRSGTHHRVSRRWVKLARVLILETVDKALGENLEQDNLERE